MTRHWQVELHQARRRVRVLEYLLRRAERPKPATIGGGNTVEGKINWLLENYGMQDINEIAARLKPHGIGRDTIKAALKVLALNCVAFKNEAGKFAGKWSLIAYGFALCLWASVATAQPALPKPDKGLTMPKVQAVTPRLRTNGVQWFKLDPGANPNRLLVNSNRLMSLPDDPYLFRVSGLATGTKQTYVVTNEYGASDIAIATVFAETNLIEEIGRIYRVPLYPNMTNWLLSSTNFKADGTSTWQPEKFLGTNGTAVFFVTNNITPQKFYKVLAY